MESVSSEIRASEIATSTDRVREAGHTAEQLPAVALTAFANKGHEHSALLGGFQIHVPKPVDPEQLIAVVAGLITRPHSSRSPATPALIQ